jgi:hypothetical protein
MFGHKVIIVVGPVSCGEEIITTFCNLKMLGTEPPNGLGVGLPIDGCGNWRSPLKVGFNNLEVVGNSEGLMDLQFQLRWDDFSR